jgi:hypothetical protein
VSSGGCSMSRIATVTVFEFRPVGTARLPRSCPCMAFTSSSRVALLLVVHSGRVVPARETPVTTRERYLVYRARRRSQDEPHDGFGASIAGPDA